MTSLEFCKCKKIDFASLSNSQARQIGNSIANITGLVVRKIGYLTGNITIPLIINEIENLNLDDTGGREVISYPDLKVPIKITFRENFTPILDEGEYIVIKTQIDNYTIVDSLFKSIAKGTLIGVYHTNAFLYCDKKSFGNDLQVRSPFHIEVVNTTTTNPKLYIYNEYYSEFLSSVTGSTITTQQWDEWNYVEPRWSIDMTHETQSVKIELYHKETNELLGVNQAYAGHNYWKWNKIAEISNNYSTNNFKLLISTIS